LTAAEVISSCRDICRLIAVHAKPMKQRVFAQAFCAAVVLMLGYERAKVRDGCQQGRGTGLRVPFKKVCDAKSRV
jgi:hypothetical protein